MTDPQPRRYRRRPPEVDAIQFTGTNADEVAAWCGGRVFVSPGDDRLHIRVGHSVVPAHPGDYVARATDPAGDTGFFPVRAAGFEHTYEPVEDGEEWRAD